MKRLRIETAVLCFMFVLPFSVFGNDKDELDAEKMMPDLEKQIDLSHNKC